MTDDAQADEDRALMRAFARYLERANALEHRDGMSVRSPLGDEISAHLGADALTVAVVQEAVPDHRLVDADIALDQLSEQSGGRLIGVTGGEQRMHHGLPELVSGMYIPFAPGAVDYVERDTGPDSSRRIVAVGLRLFHIDGAPIAVMQRAAAPQFGRSAALLEAMAVDPATVETFLQRLRVLMVERSVLRGQVLSFTPTEYGRDAGATFVPRPDVAASDVILPDGVLDQVVQHVVGIGDRRDALLRAGQHVKRGVLLYGPPGTGKTLTIRHLVSRTAGTTAVLLTGTSIQFIGAAAEIARTFQPSIVVLEDIDLVAMERHMSPQPLLFEVLEALDGLSGDADVTFIMTTNRVEVLERALAERPGRVDLAVEVPLPSLRERERLYRLYAHALPLSGGALRAAAERTEGVTASFAKELLRRTVLSAATADEPVTDAHLAAALDALLDARERLTRRMLGTADESADPDGPDGPAAWGAEPGVFGWQ